MQGSRGGRGLPKLSGMKKVRKRKKEKQNDTDKLIEENKAYSTMELEEDF